MPDPTKNRENGGDELINLRRMTSEQFTMFNDNIPTTPTSFRESGAAAPLTLKEQEKLMDEIKKENFDLKLRVYHLEDRLRQMGPSNVDSALKENVELKVQNEALLAEIKSHQEIINEAQTAIEQYRQQNASRPGAEAEIGRLRQELEQTVQQLGRNQTLCQKYEGQLALFDKESRETAQRMKQGELEINGLQKRLLDCQHSIERYEEEIKGLEEEVESKNNLIHQFKVDSQGMAQELELITKQMGELQDSLRSVQLERDNLMRERDLIKRNTLNEVAKQTGMSPRSSLDLLESKLMRELGQATKRLQDLEKQTELTHTEKEQLLGQSQSLASNLEQATFALKHLGIKMSNSTGLPLMINNSSSFPEVFEQVEQCTDHLILDYSDVKSSKSLLSEQLSKQEQVNSNLLSEKQHLELELHRCEGRLSEFQSRISVREEELRRSQEIADEWQHKATSVYDGELPQLREQISHLRIELGKLQGDLEMARAELSRSNDLVNEYKSKWEEAQSIAIQASSESSDRLAHISQLQQSRADLAKRLASAEELSQSLNRKIEDSKAQLEHADRVKSAVEEGFNRQLKSLHSTNAELKMQLATNSSGASDAQARLERLNVGMENLRSEKDNLFNKLQTKEHAIGSLQQELENLRHEKRKMETDLSLRDEQLRKAENDLVRLRKDDMLARKNTDGLSHLQAKIESLSALNAFLREQSEQKEKHIRDLEERLRRQSDEMRTTMSEVEQQSRKLKKREQLISQALRRLESINSLQLTTDGLAPVSSLGLNHLSAPTEELTPIRPSKLPFTNNANASTKENRFTSNYEF